MKSPSFDSVISKPLFGLFLLLTLIFSGFTNPQPTMNSDYILILNSYTESTPLSSSIMNPVTETMNALYPELLISTEYMNELFIGDSNTLEEFTANLESKYTQPPKLVIYIGNSSWALLNKKIDAKWAQIPTLFFAETDYSGPEENFLNNQVIAVEDRISLNTIAEKDNISVTYVPTYIRETIGLMRRLIPNMTELAFISDRRWISVELREEASRIIRTHFPDLKLTFLTEGELSSDELITRLGNTSPQTGILFSSWVQKHLQSGNTVITSDAYNGFSKYTDNPIFTLKHTGIESNGMIGGYFQSGQNTSARVSEILEDVISGKSDKNLLSLHPGDPSPVINYTVLKRKGLDEKLLPASTIYYNKPPGFIAQYKYQIVGGILCLVILLLIILILYRKKEAQKKELDLTINFRNVFNTMPIAYISMKALKTETGEIYDCLIDNINPCFNRIFATDDIIGKKGSEIHWIHIDKSLVLLNKVLLSRKEITTQYYSEHNDSYYSIIISPSVRSEYLNLFFVDNTELVRTQQLLTSVNHKLSMSLEVANIIPWKWDLTEQTILCDVNRSVELIGETNSEKERLAVSEKQYFDKIHKDDREKVQKAYGDLIAGKVHKIKEEYRVLVSDETKTRFAWMEVQAAVDTQDETGKPLSLIGSSLEITTRKNMQNELISAKEKAEESNRLKSAFLANMSHEIRTPLNAIVGFSGILANTEEVHEKQEYLSIIENNNVLLLQLISDILDLSKIEAGTLEFVYSDVDIESLLREMVQFTEIRTSPAVRVELAESVPDCYVKTEKNRVTQVLTNLINNAIKFTPSGSIKIGCKRTDSGTLFFYVKDTGLGIPQKKQADIFGRFVKLNDFSQGTGLGLSICRTIVDHMGGEIGVESQEGVGSEFWFTIPYVPSLRMEVQEKQYTPTPIQETKLTILIAEDNPDNYRLFESILKQEYKVIHAWNGKEAVELFKQHAPHIILMDINMPVMTGYEATTEIRKLSQTIPIIAVTAYAYAADEERILQSGFDGYTSKPVNAQVLRTMILDLLKKRLVFI